jgi:hypothetical protein
MQGRRMTGLAGENLAVTPFRLPKIASLMKPDRSVETFIYPV